MEAAITVYVSETGRRTCESLAVSENHKWLCIGAFNRCSFTLKRALSPFFVSWSDFFSAALFKKRLHSGKKTADLSPIGDIFHAWLLVLVLAASLTTGLLQAYLSFMNLGHV